jgi:hypothetical protein
MPPKRKGEIEVTTAHGPQINSTRQNSLSSIETISPQTSVIVTSNGAMPMQEEVRLDVAELSTQIPNGSQTERLRPNGELPYPILYDGKYHCLCVVLFAERSVRCARVFAQIELCIQSTYL